MSKNKFGKYPFEKGIYKNMYRDKLWTMRQYAGFSSVDESNKRYLKLIENGVSGLSVAFDLPTQMGYDSDDDMSFGEVGKSGVPISTIEDMERLFENINLEDISVSMTISAFLLVVLQVYPNSSHKVLGSVGATNLGRYALKWVIGILMSVSPN